MMRYFRGLTQIFTNSKAHKCYTLNFCFNLVVCGPTYNQYHWQLILMSPREQNSHCCGSSLETAGLPFLGQLAGWAAAVSKSHKSPLELILIANFCYIKILFFTVLLYVAVDSSHALPTLKLFGLNVLYFHCKDLRILQFGKKKSLSQTYYYSFEWEKLLNFLLFKLYLEFPLGQFWHFQHIVQHTLKVYSMNLGQYES